MSAISKNLFSRLSRHLLLNDDKIRTADSKMLDLPSFEARRALQQDEMSQIRDWLHEECPLSKTMPNARSMAWLRTEFESNVLVKAEGPNPTKDALMKNRIRVCNRWR
jgi:hypothetical protein